MSEEATADAEDPVGAATPDPRGVLAAFANEQDEWVRAIVRLVLSSGRALSAADLDAVYSLFRQEKGIDKRTLPSEGPLAVEVSEEDVELPLVITKLSGVTGVNAIVPGSIIEPHAGITILFGENGTGKTGYSRIFKALAGSRTADMILGDIAVQEEVPQTARVEYTIGPDAKVLEWAGEQGVAPFTRMSIFDSPAVNFHVDDDLEYVYVPTVLSLFSHVNTAIKGVHDRINGAIRELAVGSTTLLSRFPRESTIYPFVETLGASTDLAALNAQADRGSDVDQRIDALRRAVAALEADTLSTQIAERVRTQRVQIQASKAAATLAALDVEKLNSLYARLAQLQQDYRTFRSELFTAADLPTDPEETWEAFVVAGERYRAHLDALSVHDADRCLYCRQQLSASAASLIAKYSEYLTDRISSDIADAEDGIIALTDPILAVEEPDMTAFLAEHRDQEERPAAYADVSAIHDAVASVSAAIRAGTPLHGREREVAATAKGALDGALVVLAEEIANLRTHSENRSEALKERRSELADLVAAGELGKSWPTIQAQVERAKETDRLRVLGGKFTALGRAVTELAKAASDQLVNQQFEVLFTDECKALRAPEPCASG